jgi:hypothetical protein
MSTMTSTSTRSGTILIIVAGISALLAALALAFLARMRSDVEESQLLIQYAQAKIMLAAACNYVQETSRIGWDRYPSTPTVDGLAIHEEAFGWIDVRNGETGPLDRAKAPFSTAAGEWPALGSHVRCPMYAMRIPPYAIKLNAAFNPMVTKPPSSAADYCYPLLRYPDPQPMVDNGWTKAGGPGSVTGSGYAAFAKGDPTPLPESQGKAWFRVFRDGPGTFLITCGSGGTQGFKTWTEILAEGEEDLFSNDRNLFESLRNSEIRLFYRIEWTAAVTETTYHNLQHEIGRDTDHYETWPPNASHTWSSSRRTQTWMKNPVGTIRWIQRLVTEPTHW